MSRNVAISIDEFYHIYNRGNDKREVFHDEKDFARFQSLLYICNNIATTHLSNFQDATQSKLFSVEREDTIVHIGAYCLMPNHFHLLVREKIEGGTSLFMQKLSTAYTMYFNKKYDRAGGLFQGRFKAKHLNTDQYLKYQFSYIHLNPVAFVEDGWKNKKIKSARRAKEYLSSYKYSSYKDYLSADRVERVILGKEFFPDYFSNQIEIELMVDDWLKFSEKSD